MIPKNCVTSTFPAEINTFQSIGQNNWLYILSNATSSVLQCNNEITNYQLQDTGIITLPQNCKLYTDYSTLSAFHTSEENITFPIIIPDIRNEDCFKISKIKESQQLIPITINELPLDALKSIRTHLDKYSNELKKIQNSKTQSFVKRNQGNLTWIYLSIGMVMITYLLIKICNQRPNGFIRLRRNDSEDRNCIQIFNNCFDNSRRRHTQVAIPMRNLHHQTSCMSEDEDDERPSTPQSSGANAQSLF